MTCCFASQITGSLGTSMGLGAAVAAAPKTMANPKGPHHGYLGLDIFKGKISSYEAR